MEEATWNLWRFIQYHKAAFSSTSGGQALVEPCVFLVATVRNPPARVSGRDGTQPSHSNTWRARLRPSHTKYPPPGLPVDRGGKAPSPLAGVGEGAKLAHREVRPSVLVTSRSPRTAGAGRQPPTGLPVWWYRPVRALRRCRVADVA